jgi:hypothetical protein
MAMASYRGSVGIARRQNRGENEIAVIEAMAKMA